MYEWPSVENIKELGEFAVTESGQAFPGWFPHADSHIQNALDVTQRLHKSGESDLVTLAANMLWHLQGNTLSQSDDPMNEVVNQAAIDGNKRSAIANTFTFLNYNGVDTSSIPAEGLTQTVVRVSKADESSGVSAIAQFLQRYLGDQTKLAGWVQYEPEPRGSRFGFVMLAADIAQLAANSRANLMSREDIATMGQQWIKPSQPATVAPPPGLTNEDAMRQQGWENPKYNPTLFQQIQRMLNYLPDELYKYFPWAVTQLKKGNIQYNQLSHVRDILTQFRNHTEYLRTTPRNAPTWEATPDINQLDFASVEGWVYSRDKKGVDPRPVQNWQVANPAHTWEDGWHITPVTHHDDLKQEGELMGHCVGGYCQSVDDGSTTIWSLRDPRGFPHATMELEPNGDGAYRVVQIQGKSNDTPQPEYQARIREWFDKQKEEEGWQLNSAANIESVYELEEWYDNGGNMEDADAYGLSGDVYFNYEDVAREIVNDAVSDGGEPDYNVLRAYEAAADQSGDSRIAMWALEGEAEAAVSDKRDELESDLESEYSQMEQAYYEYVNDAKSEAVDRHYEEEDEEIDVDEEDLDLESFEDWADNNYSEAWRVLAWKYGDLDLEEEALNELGWTRWW